MMKMSCRLILLIIFCLGIGCRAQATEAPAPKWDSLLEVTYRFSWYPRADLQKLLETKSAEFGQSLEEYRALLLKEITGGRAPSVRIRPADFVTGLPWREYYRLSLAEFCLFLATNQEIHLQNAQEALSVLAEKTDQPEIEFWNYVYRSHQACLARNRDAFIAAAYHIWQNVILRFELETLIFPSEAAQVGFVRNLPYLYENLAHLVIRKAILEQEIPELYPLSAIILDIQPKLKIENGYKTMVDQVVERMHGANSDNSNLNYAVALLEATSRRYDFEDEKDEAHLAAKFNLARKYYLLAYNWADTGKGKAAILSEHMGFLNYVIRRFSDRNDLLVSKQFFNNLPALANDHLEKAIAYFDQLAAPAVQKKDGQPEGFEDRKIYLQTMHQLWDTTAKLAITLSGYYQANRTPEHAADIFAAVRPLEQYCDLFARHAPGNPEILPDNAYFLTAYAARELAGLYREHARFSTDNRADALAFAYQLQATEIFPLDLPGILQLAFQCTLDGRVRDYFQYSSPLAARLRVSKGAVGWDSRDAPVFAPLISMVPTLVPEVLDNAFVLLQHFPEGETPEDVLFARTVAMARVISVTQGSAEKTERLLTAIGRGEDTSPPRRPKPGDRPPSSN